MRARTISPSSQLLSLKNTRKILKAAPADLSTASAGAARCRLSLAGLSRSRAEVALTVGLSTKVVAQVCVRSAERPVATGDLIQCVRPFAVQTEANSSTRLSRSESVSRHLASA